MVSTWFEHPLLLGICISHVMKTNSHTNPHNWCKQKKKRNFAWNSNDDVIFGKRYTFNPPLPFFHGGGEGSGQQEKPKYITSQQMILVFSFSPTAFMLCILHHYSHRLSTKKKAQWRISLLFLLLSHNIFQSSLSRAIVF